MKLLRVKFLGLCNLLANKMIVPEFLQYDCNAQELTKYILAAEKQDQFALMREQLTTIKESLSANKADCSLFQLIMHEMPEKNAFFY